MRIQQFSVFAKNLWPGFMDPINSSYRKQIGRVIACVLCLMTLAWPQTEIPSDSSESNHEISPAEARELFRSVDDILKFASKETGLPIKSTVKRRLTSRDEVTDFI